MYIGGNYGVSVPAQHRIERQTFGVRGLAGSCQGLGGGQEGRPTSIRTPCPAHPHTLRPSTRTTAPLTHVVALLRPHTAHHYLRYSQRHNQVKPLNGYSNRQPVVNMLSKNLRYIFLLVEPQYTYTPEQNPPPWQRAAALSSVFECLSDLEEATNTLPGSASSPEIHRRTGESARKSSQNVGTAAALDGGAAQLDSETRTVANLSGSVSSVRDPIVTTRSHQLVGGSTALPRLSRAAFVVIVGGAQHSQKVAHLQAIMQSKERERRTASEDMAEQPSALKRRTSLTVREQAVGLLHDTRSAAISCSAPLQTSIRVNYPHSRWTEDRAVTSGNAPFCNGSIMFSISGGSTKYVGPLNDATVAAALSSGNFSVSRDDYVQIIYAGPGDVVMMQPERSGPKGDHAEHLQPVRLSNLLRQTKDEDMLNQQMTSLGNFQQLQLYLQALRDYVVQHGELCHGEDQQSLRTFSETMREMLKRKTYSKDMKAKIVNLLDSSIVVTGAESAHQGEKGVRRSVRIASSSSSSSSSS
ncbi:hypothetical protein EJ07DRAFT_160604 [Lizonia empirigonia]|nr:hypothetical protein EJ07DRAFT_160604 [Lizonia empirigonia]